MKRYIIYLIASFLVSGMMTAQDIDLNAMPEPGPTPSINIETPKSFTLNNGLHVLVVENHKLPKVNISLKIDRPPVYEGKIAGVSSIVAEQLGNGTTSISKDDFNKKVDFLGATIIFGSSTGFANSLSKYFPEILELMADATINPKFSEDEIQKSKERILESLKSNEKNANFIASRVSNAITYGKNSARGAFETEESIKSIQLKDVQNAYHQYFHPNNAYLVIVGDVKFDTAKKLIQKHFGSWKKSNLNLPEATPINNPAKTEINLINVPNAVQSIISVENITSLKMRDPQYFATIIANHILGGGSEGRLFMNLREKNGFTYGAYSNINTSKYTPSFSAMASVRNEVTDKAVKEFIHELKTINTLTPEELNHAKAKLKGDFIRSMEKPETIARFAVNSAIYNLPKNFYTHYLKSIDQVSLAEAEKAAKLNILPLQSRIFVTGKAIDIADGLEKLGYMINYYDRDANKITKPTAPPINPHISVSSILEKYLNAIGGKALLKKQNSLSMEGSSSMQGMEVVIKIKKAKEGKLVQEIIAMGNTIQKIIFDGKKGYMSMMGNKEPITEELKGEIQQMSSLFTELNLTQKNGLKMGGIEKLGNEDSYVITDGLSTHYYSVKTGLKTGEQKIRKIGGKEVMIPTIYSDYKEVNGIKLPFTITQTIMGQNMVTHVQSYVFNTAKDSDFTP
ncbi:insulinase family protein [Elizabethkingia argentiflava]|uniref:Insulinase family protein n=1 Tax=Elizabethkingia argenteiflava TaxID=2681556 RepID=A0A845PXI9_9FLAO|nr:pitrilysin family protein [Elizabethkingia argenteiflava]NAW51058.1 insulinase family protein [Elizabethkingia argenteiflava]